MAKSFLTPKNETLVVRFLVILTAYFLLRSIARRNAKLAQQDAVLNGDESSLIAVQLRQAFNPSGVPLLMGVDGTDTAAVLNAARKIKDFPAVANAYKNLYSYDLLTDLQNELSPTEFAQFQALLGKGGATGKYFVLYAVADAFEVENYDTDNPRIVSEKPLKTYNQGEMIDAEFVGIASRATPTGTDYAIFKDSKFFFIDIYFAIEAKRLVIR